MVNVYPIIASILIVLLHLLGEELSEHGEKFHEEILSLGAGLMVGVFFLEIFPQLTVGEVYLNSSIYVLFLSGFAAVHVIDQLVYRDIAERVETEKIWFEAVGLVIYGLMLGFIVTIFFDTFQNLGFILLIPFYLRTFVASIMSEHVILEVGTKAKYGIQFSPLVGTLMSMQFITGNPTIVYSVFAVLMGFLLYILVRDMLPLGRAGNPRFFLIGIIVTIASFLVT